jgi:xanthine/uracil permease
LYTGVFLGGAVLALAGFSKLLVRLRSFFTPRIVAVILVLIVFTLSPVILRLTTGEGGGAPAVCFALIMLCALVLINEKLKGAFKSLTVLIGLAGGALAFGLLQGELFPASLSAGDYASFPWDQLSRGISFKFDPGVLLAFIFCFLALAVNEIGSIEAVGRMVKAGGMDGRLRRGTGITGLANMASGLLGVIGPVDYSLSAGVIAATGCASRLTFVPAGLGLLACAFFPQLILALTLIPGPVMGALLLYIMVSQLAGGLALLVAEKGVTDFSSGLTVALPLMLGLFIAFVPPELFSSFPGMLRPLIGNGFVMGALAVIILEHGIFRQR